LYETFDHSDPKKIRTFPVRLIKKFITEFPTLGIRATLEEELEYQNHFEPPPKTLSKKEIFSKRFSLQATSTNKLLNNPHLLSQLSSFVPDLSFLFKSLLDYIAINYKNRIPILLNFLETSISRMKEQEKIFFAHRISERLISMKNPNPRLIQCCLLVMAYISSSSNFKNLILLEEVFKINGIQDYDQYFEYFLTVVNDSLLVYTDIEPKKIWFNDYQDDTEVTLALVQKELQEEYSEELESKVFKLVFEDYNSCCFSKISKLFFDLF
jgi:hypothetical protein